jgi:hypothetical protein
MIQVIIPVIAMVACFIGALEQSWCLGFYERVESRSTRWARLGLLVLWVIAYYLGFYILFG